MAGARASALVALALAALASSEEAVIHTSEVYNRDLPFANPDGGAWKQGFPIKYDPSSFNGEPIHVWIMPWSHNDPGWRITYDAYFSGESARILDNAVSVLLEKPWARFVWTEICFLQRWWDEHASADQRASFRQLVESGRMEIATGGWVMTDEAAPHYEGIVQQLAEGHEWVWKNLGVRPRTGWSNDPFGHSPTVAHVAALSGVGAIAINRVHYAVKRDLALRKAFEFTWRQRWVQGPHESDAFTHMLPFWKYDVAHTCGPDPKVCALFDFTWAGRNSLWNDPVVDLTASNVKKMAGMLAEQYRQKAMLFRTNNIFAPIGDDFYYQDRSHLTKQLDSYKWLADVLNADPSSKVKLHFSNLSQYFDAVRGSAFASQGFPVVSGDFFTYSDVRQDYWSGYYVSRPYHKRASRILYSSIRAAEQLLATTHVVGRPPAEEAQLAHDIQTARRVLGVFHHHDGIAGTSANSVMDDYARMLHNSELSTRKVLRALARQSLSLSSDPEYSEEETSGITNLATQRVLRLGNAGRTVVLYNSLSFDRTEVVTVLVDASDVIVAAANGKPVDFAQLCLQKGDVRQLSFVATVPAMSFASYSVKHASSGTPGAASPCTTEDIQTGETCLENGRTRVCLINGCLQKIAFGEGFTTEVNVGESYQRYSTTRSGPYIFRPNGEPAPLSPDITGATLTRGKVFSEVIVRMGKDVKRRLRVYNEELASRNNFIDVTELADVRNGEVVARLQTNLAYEGSYFMDQNGFDTAHRYHRADMPIASNFYPFVSWMFVQDGNARLTIQTRQPLGASCRGDSKSAFCEVMLDRWASEDDGKGLGDNMKDNVPVEEDFRLMVEPAMTFSQDESHQTREAAEASTRLNHPLIVLFAPADTKDVDSAPLLAQGALDSTINVLRFRYEADGRYTLVLSRAPEETSGEKECVWLQGMFGSVTVTSATRHSLTFLTEFGTIDMSKTLCLAPGDMVALKLKVAALAPGEKSPQKPTDVPQQTPADVTAPVDTPAQERPQKIPQKPQLEWKKTPEKRVTQISIGKFLVWLISLTGLVTLGVLLYHKRVLGVRGVAIFFSCVAIFNVMILIPS